MAAVLGVVPDPFHKSSDLGRERKRGSSSPVPPTVFVPGGRFAVGAAWVDGRPLREAEVRPLRFGVAPVGNASYAAFLAVGAADEPPFWRDPDLSDPEQPVVGVTWFEAVAFCAWLRDTMGGRWRLPSEAEWEHAFGLLDLGSSVHEWCHDWFTPDLLRPARRYDPRGPELGEKRVRRGGPGRDGARAACWRDGLEPAGRKADGGFRVVREVP